jgi:ArsR family transcriptional regulator, arsenate/arsenite/antimonite-responsive transcriptional repressor
MRTLYLLACRELCVCELVAVLQMPQGKVSRHLAVLKSAGLVADRRAGTWIYYSLAAVSHPLGELLHGYLAEPHSEESLGDRARLDQLCCAGDVCTLG